MRHRFWEQFGLEELNEDEWEALCDGCGRCCLHKFDYDTDDTIRYTKVACRLLDCDTCRCRHYEARKKIVTNCIKITTENIESVLHWLPQTCAYRLLHENRPLFDWHYLISGSRDTVHQSGISVKGLAVSETEIPLEELENHMLEENIDT